MNRVVTTYCTSCWIPAVVHAVSFFLACPAISCLLTYEPYKNLPKDITWLIIVVLITWVVVSWLIMPLSVLVNLYKKHWLKSAIAMFLSAIVTLPIVLFVLFVRAMSSWH